MEEREAEAVIQEIFLTSPGDSLQPADWTGAPVPLLTVDVTN